jgi:hypothetical protein
VQALPAHPEQERAPGFLLDADIGWLLTTQ